MSSVIFILETDVLHTKLYYEVKIRVIAEERGKF